MPAPPGPVSVTSRLSANRLAQLGQLGVAADEAAQPLPQIAGGHRRRGPGRRDRSRARWGERRVLGQDAGLELPQRRARVQAQLLDQAITDFGVGAQGLGLPSAPVQGEDEQLPQALAQRVFPAQRLQFAGQFPVPPQAQLGAGPGFGRHQGQLVQPGPFGIKKARISELGQRLTAPQAERFAQGR